MHKYCILFYTYIVRRTWNVVGLGEREKSFPSEMGQLQRNLIDTGWLRERRSMKGKIVQSRKTDFSLLPQHHLQETEVFFFFFGVPVSGVSQLWVEKPAPPKDHVNTCCSVVQSCPTLCDPMGFSTPGFPVLHHLPELAQTHVWVKKKKTTKTKPLSQWHQC